MNSADLFNKAKNMFPGGVNSPVRYYAPNPVYFRKAIGDRIFDVNGKEYLDFNMGFGAMIAGYGNEEVISEVHELDYLSIPLGVPSELEILLADEIKAAIPSIEMMRFTNSGTEATMHAIRLARAYTGRKLIIKMNAGFHGSHDYVLISAGSGALTFGTPSSPGIPDEIGKTVLVSDYNNIADTEALFKKYSDQIAALIVEPILGNIGLINPDAGYLKNLEKICHENGALLILDEVITGFRFGYNGYQNIADLNPDLTILGKIIGGGLPIGLFGGKRKIMEMISPSGKVYQSGTFSANPATMASGLATLHYLKNADYKYIGKMVDLITNILQPYINEHEIILNQYQSMFQIFFTGSRVYNFKSAMASDSKRFMSFFKYCLQKGVYLSPGQYETNFIGFLHSPEDVEIAATVMEGGIEASRN